MNIDQYLNRLNLQSHRPSLKFLNEILSSHQKIISFNNLAVFYKPGQILNLDLEALFEKVIMRGEGGYCFENNKVLYYLLEGLGFKVERKSARVIYDKTGDVPRTHRTTVVTIDGQRFLADVGFGRDVPPRAIPIGLKQTSGYHVVAKDDLYHLQLFKGESIINLYTFDDGHYQESDFTVANYFTNTHPDSKFVKELIVSRKDQDFIEFMSGKTYSRIENDKRDNFEIQNQEEFQFYLKKFGIEHPYDFSKLSDI